jgi:hypothetical protein
MCWARLVLGANEGEKGGVLLGEQILGGDVG